MFTLGLFLCPHPLPMTRPIEWSINGASASPRNQWQEIKRKQRVRLLSHALIRTPARLCQNKTLPYQIFRAAPAAKSFINRSPYKVKHTFSILQIVTRNYSNEVDYRTFCLANRLTYYNKTVSRYISKVVKENKLQMEEAFLRHERAHFHNPISHCLYSGVRLWQKPWERSYVDTALHRHECLSNDTRQPYVRGCAYYTSSRLSWHHWEAES